MDIKIIVILLLWTMNSSRCAPVNENTRTTKENKDFNLVTNPELSSNVLSNYEFEYAVHDDTTGDIKSHRESRKNGNVEGRYELIEPDGYRRIVEYSASAEKGFVAFVYREPTELVAGYSGSKKSINSPIKRQSEENRSKKIATTSDPLISTTTPTPIIIPKTTTLISPTSTTVLLTNSSRTEKEEIDSVSEKINSSSQEKSDQNLTTKLNSITTNLIQFNDELFQFEVSPTSHPLDILSENTSPPELPELEVPDSVTELFVTEKLHLINVDPQELETTESYVTLNDFLEVSVTSTSESINLVNVTQYVTSSTEDPPKETIETTVTPDTNIVDAEIKNETASIQPNTEAIKIFTNFEQVNSTELDAKQNELVSSEVVQSTEVLPTEVTLAELMETTPSQTESPRTELVTTQKEFSQSVTLTSAEPLFSLNDPSPFTILKSSQITINNTQENTTNLSDAKNGSITTENNTPPPSADISNLQKYIDLSHFSTFNWF